MATGIDQRKATWLLLGVASAMPPGDSRLPKIWIQPYDVFGYRHDNSRLFVLHIAFEEVAPGVPAWWFLDVFDFSGDWFQPVMEAVFAFMDMLFRVPDYDDEDDEDFWDDDGGLWADPFDAGGPFSPR